MEIVIGGWEVFGGVQSLGRNIGVLTYQGKIGYYSYVCLHLVKWAYCRVQSFKILDWKSSSGFSCFHLRGISELLWEINYYQYEDRPAAESTLDWRRRWSMPTKFDNVLNETIKILRSRSVFFSKSLSDNLWISIRHELVDVLYICVGGCLAGSCSATCVMWDGCYGRWWSRSYQYHRMLLLNDKEWFKNFNDCKKNLCWFQQSSCWFDVERDSLLLWW